MFRFRPRETGKTGHDEVHTERRPVGPHTHGVGRREFLRSVGLGALGLTGIAQARPAGPPGPKAERALRIAFLTDVHLPSAERNNEFARALRLAQGPDVRADMILFGGDNVFAQDSARPQEAKAQFENWQRMIREHVRIPSLSCLGNHDLVGIGQPADFDINSAKELAMKSFGMPDRFFAVQREGWRFLVLDTVHHRALGYHGHIDSEQLAWLEDELENHKVPTVLLGHIPIVSVTGAVSSKTSRTAGYTKLSHRHQITNSREVLEVFRKHPHARLALSGHNHMIDHVRFRNTHFVCGGAVSGAWWRGAHEHFPASIFVIDLFRDGALRAFPMTCPASV